VIDLLDQEGNLDLLVAAAADDLQKQQPLMALNPKTDVKPQGSTERWRRLESGR
jgi:hypothetical protein